MFEYNIPTIIYLLEDYAIAQGLTTLTVHDLENFAKLPGHPSRTTVWRKVGSLKEINRLVRFPLKTPTLLDLVALTPDSAPNLADFTPVATASDHPTPEPSSPTPPEAIPASHHNPRLRHYHHSVHTLIDRYLTTHRIHTITRAILARITALPGAPPLLPSSPTSAISRASTAPSTSPTTPAPGLPTPSSTPSSSTPSTTPSVASPASSSTPSTTTSTAPVSSPSSATSATSRS